MILYIEFLNSIKHDTEGTIGAIVTNCNPFNLGNKYLIEKVCSEVDFLYIFAKYIAPALNISTRFVGEEPMDITTRKYNEFMEHILPKYNINFVKYDRCEFNAKPISVSTVRALIKDKSFDEIKELVPETTYNYLKNNF